MPTSARQPPGPGQSAERTIPRPCCRGGLHIRPEPGTVSPGPRWLREPGTDAPCAPLRRVRSAVVLLTSIPSGPMWASAPTGCGRRWCVRRSGAARAAMKAAPTPRFSFSRRGGLYGRPEAGALRQGSTVPPRGGAQTSKIGAAAIGNSPRLSKNPAEDFWDRAAGNVCKGLRPLKVNCPKGKRSWPGPCAFNQHVFLNFY